MWRSTRIWRGVACVAGLLSAGACGAGLITGIAVSNRNGSNPEAPAPEISISPLLPLVPASDTTRTAVVANAQIPAAAQLRVRIEAAGVAVDQLDPSVSGQGGSTAITFTLATGPIVAAIGDPTGVDVNGTLDVLVDGEPVAAAAPIVLVRQPRAELIVTGSATELFLSPLGERVRLRVPGLLSSEATDLQVLVATLDPAAQQPGTKITRVASGAQREADEGGVPVVSAIVPGITFPVQAEIVVRDAIAGQSTTVTNAYYRPDIAIALPSQGPTTGGTLLTLIGTALLPYDFDAGSGPAPFDFDAIRLRFEKGDGSGRRITQLDPVELRTDESGSDRLVFTVPPSPDGRPGQVDIVLRVELGAVTAQVTASQVFLFANPDPFFGPRGVVLATPPVAVAPIGLDQAPSTTAAPDFAVLTEEGGVAFVQLLLAQQNGMFQPFAAPRQIADHQNPAERGPRDLCVGDFNGDGVPDVFVANVGAATAVHHVVLGQAAPLAPLGDVYAFAAPPGTYRCRAALIDGDSLPDVVLVPGPEAPPAQRPHVLLARPAPLPPLGTGAPGFTAPILIDVRSFPYEAFDVADLDGDGELDFAVTSGTQGKLDVAWGIGDGSFVPGTDPTAVALDFTVPNYALNPASPAIGLHACADGPHQSLGLLLAGVPPPAPPPPVPSSATLTVLRQSTLRVFAVPAAAETTALPEPIGKSLVANVDGVGDIELVVAAAGDPSFASLAMFRFGPTGFDLLDTSIEGGAESPRNIRALVFDRAFPAPPKGAPKNAVFIVHTTDVDGLPERRLSTRLVSVPPGGDPILLPPDAGANVPFAIHNVVMGDFLVDASSGGAARDLAVAQLAGPTTIDAVVIIGNDGFGGEASLGNQLAFAGLLADSLAVLPAAPGTGDALVFAARDSRLGSWHPIGTGTPPVTAQLRALVPTLAAVDLADSTRLRVADVDGDGVQDLVVLMSFALPDPQEGEAAIALLRGKVNPAPGEFPFWFPTAVAPVHGKSSSIALGDFANAGPQQPRVLELAVAVPASLPLGPGNDHVRFLRYVAGATPADDRFEASALAGGPQVLLAGSSPTELAAADFDRDGTVDLLVACRGDDQNQLRLYRNTAGADPTEPNVDIEAFHEANNSPWLLASGLPTALRLSDVNGDGNVDAIAFVEFTSSTTSIRSTTIAMYLSSGAGSFDGPRFLSPQRIGNRDAMLSGDLGDWNRDGVPDLFLGWNTSASDINLRILSGGTR